MSKVISEKDLSATLSLSECSDGFWLWDETRQMNLAMKSKSPESALVEAITYYQRRLKEVESDYKSLKAKVESFIGEVASDEDDEYFYCDRCGTSHHKS